MTDRMLLLALVHNLSNATDSSFSAINSAVDLAIMKQEDYIKIPIEAAMALGTIMKTQNHTMKLVTEENAQIQDELDELIAKIKRGNND